MPPQISVIFVLGTYPSPLSRLKILSHLQQIPLEPAKTGTLASMLNKQELIDAKVLVPILRNELEESESREQGNRVMLVDGFPRNLAQRREFEEAQAGRRTHTRSLLQLSQRNRKAAVSHAHSTTLTIPLGLLCKRYIHPPQPKHWALEVMAAVAPIKEALPEEGVGGMRKIELVLSYKKKKAG
ncbi:hypothetical protein F5882DRAFT_387708 [Hyaloscypha sp. PMI_1271]|nr:hypothetical protein F5882DRAFT_387708 [Hyaloscypha sp. PMI_1271]